MKVKCYETCHLPWICKEVPVFFRAAYGYDVKAASDEATIPADLQGESLTVQSHAEDADLNTLLKRFGVIQGIPADARVPLAGDFTDITDYQSALNAVLAANNDFMRFPAEIRARFENDPQKLLEFCDNRANLEEARKLGLVPPAPVIPDPGTTVLKKE